MKALRVVDYGGAVACLAYGAYTGSALWMVGGAVGLVVAAINPAQRVSRRLKAKHVKKESAEAQLPAVVAQPGAPEGLSSEPVKAAPAGEGGAKTAGSAYNSSIKAPYRFY